MNGPRYRADSRTGARPVHLSSAMRYAFQRVLWLPSSQSGSATRAPYDLGFYCMFASRSFDALLTAVYNALEKRLLLGFAPFSQADSITQHLT